MKSSLDIMWSCVSYRNQKYDDDWMKIWDARCMIWDVRNGKSDVGNEDFECLYPISHFVHDILIKENWIGSRKMGNGIQMRILMTEVSTSELVIQVSYHPAYNSGLNALVIELIIFYKIESSQTISYQNPPFKISLWKFPIWKWSTEVNQRLFQSTKTL